MKKITESELKARVNRLREYLVIAEAAPDPKVTAFQQELIKKGAKIKADGMYGPATNQAAMQFGMAPPAGIATTANAGTAPAKPVAATKPAAPAATGPANAAAPAATNAASLAAAQGKEPAPVAGAEKRTPAEIAASADLLSANNAGNINAGLTPDDPRWQGPKPDAAKNPVGTTNAATAIPTGGLENPANQAAPTATAAAPATTAAAPSATTGAATKPAAVPNPYTNPASAAKFAALTPQDQAWLTKGGGVPDINDNIILSRAPNKGKPAAPAAAPAAAAAAPTATAGTPPPPQVAIESVGFDEIQRLVSLVQYR